jgi:hypothetical protein
MNESLKNLKDRAVAYVKDLYAREPARVNASVLAVLTAVGIAIPVGGAAAAVIAAALAILLGGEVTRSQVTPAKKQKS